MHFRCSMVSCRASSVVYVCFIVMRSSMEYPRSKKNVGRKSWLVTSSAEWTNTLADCDGTNDNAHFLSVSNKSLMRSFRTLASRIYKTFRSDKNDYGAIKRRLLFLGRSIIGWVEGITKSLFGVQGRKVVATWNVFVLILAQLEEAFAGNAVFECQLSQVLLFVLVKFFCHVAHGF